MIGIQLTADVRPLSQRKDPEGIPAPSDLLRNRTPGHRRIRFFETEGLPRFQFHTTTCFPCSCLYCSMETKESTLEGQQKKSNPSHSLPLRKYLQTQVLLDFFLISRSINNSQNNDGF